MLEHRFLKSLYMLEVFGALLNNFWICFLKFISIYQPRKGYSTSYCAIILLWAAAVLMPCI